jgi:hypothetical protein
MSICTQVNSLKTAVNITPICGDIVSLRRQQDGYYDWRSIQSAKEWGFYLRDVKSLNLLNTASGRAVLFKNSDVCLVLEAKSNLVLVLNPRAESGLIHVDKIEVLNERI